jgi:hypothetical protein
MDTGMDFFSNKYRSLLQMFAISYPDADIDLMP